MFAGDIMDPGGRADPDSGMLVSANRLVATMDGLSVGNSVYCSQGFPLNGAHHSVPLLVCILIYAAAWLRIAGWVSGQGNQM